MKKLSIITVFLLTIPYVIAETIYMSPSEYWQEKKAPILFLLGIILIFIYLISIYFRHYYKKSPEEIKKIQGGTKLITILGMIFILLIIIDTNSIITSITRNWIGIGIFLAGIPYLIINWEKMPNF